MEGVDPGSAKLPGRDRQVVVGHGSAWAAAQDEIIRARYSTDGASTIARELGRTIGAVRRRAQVLKIVGRRTRWTERETKLVALNWGDMPLAELAAKVGRTPDATWVKAGLLGLQLGCPNGREYLSDAAKRTGYQVAQLRRILEWARVPVAPTMSRTHGGKHRHSCVVPYDVDRAVAAWLEGEKLGAAARARGMTWDRLVGLLRRARALPKRHRKWSHWRIPSAVIDAAIARAA